MNWNTDINNKPIIQEQWTRPKLVSDFLDKELNIKIVFYPFVHIHLSQIH